MKPRLEDWYINNNSCIVGQVYNDPRFEDGTVIITSRVADLDIRTGEVITKNSRYVLGKGRGSGMIATIKTWLSRAAYAALAVALLAIAYFKNRLTAANQQVEIAQTKEETTSALQKQAVDQVQTQDADATFNALAAQQLAAGTDTKPKP